MCESVRKTNLDAKCDRLHDKDPVREDSSNFLNTGKILDRIPDVSVFIQQLELPCRENGSRTEEREEAGEGGLKKEVQRWKEEETCKKEEKESKMEE